MTESILLPRQVKDMRGQRFGRWTVLEYVPGKPVAHWLCQCDCSKQKVVNGGSLRSGATVSCGCFQKEFTSALHRKHYGRGTPEYKAWVAIKDRCQSTAPKFSKYYLEKGIKVCERWCQFNGFENFLADMGPRPSPKHSIDRIDGNKGYEPEKCRWATQKEQGRNRTKGQHLITFDGETRCMSEWAEIIGITPGCLKVRLKHWTIEKALTTPPKKQ